MHIPAALIHAGGTAGGSSIAIFLAVTCTAVLMLCGFFTGWHMNSRQKDKELNRQLKRNAELAAILSQLQLSHQTLLQQTAFQKRIIAAIVHGIKSPLKYLTLTGKQLYNMNNQEASLRDVLGSMYTSSHHMYTFTDNLLQYVKLHLRQHSPVPDTCNLYDLVHEKVLMFKDIAVSRGNSIENHVNEELTMYTDRQLISIIVHNLLDNAVKYTTRGVITLSAWTSDIHIYMSIRDTGIGMDVGIQERLDDLSSIEPGLGLVITRQLLSMLQGKLEISSEPGAGTTVVLCFERFPQSGSDNRAVV